MTKAEPTAAELEILAKISPSFFGSRASQRPDHPRSHDATKMSERITRDGEERAQPPLHKKPGPICGGLRGGGVLGGLRGGRKPRPSKLADDLHDAAFGKHAQRLAAGRFEKDDNDVASR
jgi:hypothetical protein